METRSRERTTMARWIQSPAARFNSAATERSVFNREQRGVYKRLQHKSEQHRLRSCNRNIQLATASPLQRQGVCECLEPRRVRAAFAGVRESEPTGRFLQIRLEWQRSGNDGVPAVNFEIDGCPS